MRCSVCTPHARSHTTSLLCALTFTRCHPTYRLLYTFSFAPRPFLPLSLSLSSVLTLPPSCCSKSSHATPHPTPYHPSHPPPPPPTPPPQPPPTHPPPPPLQLSPPPTTHTQQPNSLYLSITRRGMALRLPARATARVAPTIEKIRNKTARTPGIQACGPSWRGAGGFWIIRPALCCPSIRAAPRPPRSRPRHPVAASPPAVWHRRSRRHSPVG